MRIQNAQKPTTGAGGEGIFRRWSAKGRQIKIPRKIMSNPYSSCLKVLPLLRSRIRRYSGIKNSETGGGKYKCGGNELSSDEIERIGDLYRSNFLS